MWVSGGDAPFLAPSGSLSLSIADGEGWGEAASLLVRPKNLPLSMGAAEGKGGDACIAPVEALRISYCL